MISVNGPDFPVSDLCSPSAKSVGGFKHKAKVVSHTNNLFLNSLTFVSALNMQVHGGTTFSK